VESINEAFTDENGRPLQVSFPLHPLSSLPFPSHHTHTHTHAHTHAGARSHARTTHTHTQSHDTYGCVYPGLRRQPAGLPWYLPTQNIRIRHTLVLDDPFDDPPQLEEHIPEVWISSPTFPSSPFHLLWCRTEIRDGTILKQVSPEPEFETAVDRLEDDWVPQVCM
jgi:hypothetical protein